MESVLTPQKQPKFIRLGDRYINMANVDFIEKVPTGLGEFELQICTPTDVIQITSAVEKASLLAWLDLEAEDICPKRDETFDGSKDTIIGLD